MRAAYLTLPACFASQACASAPASPAHGPASPAPATRQIAVEACPPAEGNLALSQLPLAGEWFTGTAPEFPSGAPTQLTWRGDLNGDEREDFIAGEGGAHGTTFYVYVACASARYQPVLR